MTSIPILVIAAVQGILLYGLHHSVEHKTWPSTDSSWLLALYPVALFVPVTLQFLAAGLRHRSAWIVAGAIALVSGGLGAYVAWAFATQSTNGFLGATVTLYGALFAAWFIAMPFAQTWLRHGGGRVTYLDLFEFSWQNALLLLEACLFTGIFWVLLLLGGALFKIVHISAFWDLFVEPAFIYPASSIAFGYGIYLVGSHENIIVTLRRHVLGVFSWLLPLAALIAVLFVLALPFTGLRPLWQTGHASTLMLWLQVLFIHFLNSAYQDGQAEPRYPAWLKLVLRLAVFALPVYAALCAYSLGLRVEQHGWTVPRVWAAIATLLAGAYGLGYAAAALQRSPWMGRMARINVWMAAVVAAVLLLATSPLLDPSRLAAGNQVARLRAGIISAANFDFDYLRFELGRYGRNGLAELSKESNPEIAKLAAASLAKTSRYDQRTVPPESLASRIQLYPTGTVLDPALLDYLKSEVRSGHWQHPTCLSRINEKPCLMFAVDLNADGQPEILALYSHPQTVYSKVDGQWKEVGSLVGPSATRQQIDAAIRESKVTVEPVKWSDVNVGGVRYRLQVSP